MPTPPDHPLLSLISHIPYLHDLPAPQQTTLLRSASRHAFAANALIFLEGDPNAGLWLIEQGQVKIHKLSAEGGEYILHLLGQGHSFNDIAALEAGPNPANATTLTEAVCWCIPSATLHHILDTTPHAAHAAIRMLTGRVRLLVGQLEGLALYSVAARLARFLLQQAETPASDGVTRVAIAAHLATTPESVSRALRSLEQAGAIAFNRHQIEIVDAKLLRALALLDDPS